MKKTIKILVAALILSASTSCKKDKAVACYYCEFEQVPGYPQKFPEDVCDDDLQNRIFVDDYGNEVTAHCTKK